MWLIWYSYSWKVFWCITRLCSKRRIFTKCRLTYRLMSHRTSSGMRTNTARHSQMPCMHTLLFAWLVVHSLQKSLVVMRTVLAQLYPPCYAMWLAWSLDVCCMRSCACADLLTCGFVLPVNVQLATMCVLTVHIFWHWYLSSKQRQIKNEIKDFTKIKIEALPDGVVCVVG